MNLDLLNIVGVKGVTQPSALQTVATEEGEGLLEGGLFLSMLQEASSTETTETKENQSPIAVLPEETLTSPQALELKANSPAILEDAALQEEITISTPQNPKPVTLNNTIGEEVVENIQPMEAKQPVNMQLAFLMNDVSKDVKIAETTQQVAPKAASVKLEEKPIEELSKNPEIKLSTKTPTHLIATQEVPKAPKKLITTAKVTTIKESAEEAKAELPQTQAQISPKAEPIALPQAFIPQPQAIVQNAKELNANPTNIEFVKLVPHKVISEEKPIELSSKPLLIAPNDFEKFVEPLVMSYEAPVTAELPVEQLAIIPTKTHELPITPALKEYVPLSKPQHAEHSVPQQISVNLMKSIENGKESMTFKLQPADLGEVDIKFQTTKEGVTQVSILSDKFTTFDSISRSVQQIENILHQSGFKSENLSIDVGLKEHSHQQQNGKQQNEFVAFNNNEQFSAEVISFMPKHDGLLNIVI